VLTETYTPSIYRFNLSVEPALLSLSETSTARKRLGPFFMKAATSQNSEKRLCKELLVHMFVMVLKIAISSTKN
jgi:hypothetical protein